MFNWFKKKSVPEKLIDKLGMGPATAGFAMVISEKLSTPDIAYQFVLEELEAASKGNAEAQAFARNSGIPASEYKGSLDNSRPEVDGPGGPQQTVLAMCLQMRDKPDLMVKFRIGVLDKIMRQHKIGKYLVDGDADGDAAVGPSSSSRITRIASHLVNLSDKNLDLVGAAIKPGHAEALVEECANEIRDDVFETFDTKVVAMAVMQNVASNGAQFGESEKKTACMLAMSVIWAAKKMADDGYALTKDERTVVITLEHEARALLKQHYAVVDVLPAKLWIAATLSESPQ